MTTKKKTEAQAARVRLLANWRGNDCIRGVQDMRTGQRWQWRELDYPGLGDFLEEMVLTWHPLAHREYKRAAGSREASKDAARARSMNRLKRIEVLQREAAKLHRMKKEAIAATLADRGFGGKEAILKLLRVKKSSEGN